MVLRYTAVFILVGYLAGSIGIPLNLSNSYIGNSIPAWKWAELLEFKEQMHFDAPSAEEQRMVLTNMNDARVSLMMNVDPQKVGFYLYTKANSSKAIRVNLNDPDGLKAAGYDKSIQTKLIVHGFLGSLASTMIQEIKDNLLSLPNENMNVIAVDWSVYTLFYVNVYDKTRSVGSLIGTFIDYLETQGTSKETIHCIGHSLGAHVCGFAGDQVNGLIARITGLDPAQPGFDVRTMKARLNSNDAMFVDCIHTDAGVLGITEPICTADYYPNSGAAQPGCSWLDIFGICSHGRSHEYFAESILPGHDFPALSCQSLNFLPNDCSDHGARMGYPATERFTGIFYLTTRSTKPYALNVTDA